MRVSKLQRRILDAVITGPFAWSRIEELTRRLSTHHPNAVRAAIRTLCDDRVLERWPLAQGHAVTLTPRTARALKVHLVEVARPDPNTGQPSAEVPVWRHRGDPRPRQRVLRDHVPRVPRRIVELQRKLAIAPSNDPHATEEAKAEEALTRRHWQEAVNVHWARYEKRMRRLNEPTWLQDLKPCPAQAAKRLWKGRATLVADSNSRAG